MILGVRKSHLRIPLGKEEELHGKKPMLHRRMEDGVKIGLSN